MGDGMGSGRADEWTREGVDVLDGDSEHRRSNRGSLEEDLEVALLVKVFEQEPEVAYFQLLNELEEEVQ